MRLYLSNFAHLLVIVVVSGVTLASPLRFLLLTNTSYTRANVDQSSTTNRLKNDIKPVGEKKTEIFTSTWTKIAQNPPNTLEVAVGSRVELQCEVAGNPPPQVYWITGNEPERQIQELTTRAQEASNVVSTEWEGVSKIVSTYVIDCVRPEDQGLKYCVSVSKNIVDQSATVLLVNTTRTTVCSSESQPTITLHATWRFALQRNTVILPCRAAGQPTPYLFWIDNLGQTVSPATHARHTVLASGDLEISDLEWADMGEYICKVQSGYTEKNVSTFLYPVRSESEIIQTENPA